MTEEVLMTTGKMPPEMEKRPALAGMDNLPSFWVR